VGSSQTVSVGSDDSLTVGGGRTESIANDLAQKVDGGRSSEVANDDALKVGKTLVVDVAESITIKTGDASITMNKDGTITIKGKDITIDGSGEINGKAGKNIVLKGQKILQN
jgi:type VI secretion system secreted protein VgrG